MKNLKNKGFTLIELMIVVAIIGILSAIAIPNFIKFQARSKQSEAKANTKSIFTAQRSYFQEKEGYATTLSAVGFAPERGNRYSYVLDAGSGNQTRSAATVSTGSYGLVEADVYKYGTVNFAATYTPASVSVAWVAEAGESQLSGIATVLPGVGGGFAAYAVGSVDNETAGIDTWFIGSQSGSITAGPCTQTNANFVAGEPVHGHDDVACD